MSSVLIGQDWPPNDIEIWTLAVHAEDGHTEQAMHVSNMGALTECEESLHLPGQCLRAWDGTPNGLHTVGRSTDESRAGVDSCQCRRPCGNLYALPIDIDA